MISQRSEDVILDRREGQRPIGDPLGGRVQIEERIGQEGVRNGRLGWKSRRPEPRAVARTKTDPVAASTLTWDSRVACGGGPWSEHLG